MDKSNPNAAPQSATLEPTPTPGNELQEIPPGSDPIDVGACVRRGFELTKRNFGTIILAGLAFLGVVIVAAIILDRIDSALGLEVKEVPMDLGNGQIINVPIEGPSLLNNIVSNVLSIFLSLGLCRFGLNLVSGKPAAVGQLFGEGNKLLRAIGASILFGITVAVGLVLLVIPGIYVMLRYGQFMYAIVDRNLGVMESFHYSSSITKNNRGKIFILGLAAIGICIAGALALLVGLIFAIPMTYMSWVVAYRWMQYGKAASMDEPGTTTPLLSAV